MSTYQSSRDTSSRAYVGVRPSVNRASLDVAGLHVHFDAVEKMAALAV